MNRIASGTVLFVDGFGDAVLERCRSALERGGHSTERVEDVYAAMARLAQSPAVSHVVIDSRYLDEAESAFLVLAPRYFQHVEFMVPALAGRNDWLNVDVPGVRRVSPEDLERGIGCDLPPAGPAGGSAASETGAADETVPDSNFAGTADTADPAEFGIPLTREELDALAEGGYEVTDLDAVDDAGESDQAVADQPRSMPVLPDRPLSTDRDRAEESDEESLHDAVRRRMSGDGGPVVRRRPPGSDSSSDEDASSAFHDALPKGDWSDADHEETDAESFDDWSDSSVDPEKDEGARG